MAPGLGSRADALERLATTTAQPLDVLVVGGGITGAGIALDAASRGLTTGLVERFDFASGTSSKSSKLVHGGLRYLEQREFGLMREASVERDLLRRLAPHLVEPIPFLLPVADRWRRAQFGAGLWAYDALATFRNLKTHKHISRDETQELVPLLHRSAVRGGYLFYDCKTDDVRLVMENLIQARRYGAVVVNHTAVRDLSSGSGVASAAVEDTVTGEIFEIGARRVIVAAGVWTDRVESLARADSSPRLRPSKGIHLVFTRESLPMADTAAFIPDVSRRRMLFVIPWLDSVIVGTTDAAHDGDLDRPSVNEDDRTYVLDSVNRIFDTDLDNDDVAGAYAGLRPLIAGRAGATADLSRRHAVYELAPGIVGITGGKLTTYRRMAVDAVDRAMEGLGHEARSKTRWIRLGSSDVGALRYSVERRAHRLGIDAPAWQNLVRSYGERAFSVLELAASEGLAHSIAPNALPIAAEAAYCARAEMAVHLSDLLARRTRLALTDRAAGIGPDNVAGAVMAAELGWSSAELTREIESHRSEVERERCLPVAREAPPATERRATL